MTNEEAMRELELTITEIEGDRYARMASELRDLHRSLRQVERRYQRRQGTDLTAWYGTCLARSMDLSATIAAANGRLSAIEFSVLNRVQDALNDYNDAISGRESDDDEAGNHATL